MGSLYFAKSFNEHALHEVEECKTCWVCDRKKLPWVLEFRHTAPIWKDPRLKNLVEHGFICGNIAHRV